MSVQVKMHRYFDRNIGHFVLSPYAPTTVVKVKMHCYYDRERNHHVLSPYPPTKPMDNFNEETSVCPPSILDTPPLFDPTPLLPAYIKQNVLVNSPPILDDPLMFDPTPLLPALIVGHNVPVSLLIEAEVSCNDAPTENACKISLLDEELPEEKDLQVPILTPTVLLSTLRIRRAPTMKQELSYQRRVTKIVIKLIITIQQLEMSLAHASFECSMPKSSTKKSQVCHISELCVKHVPPAKSADPRAPASNFSEVLPWSLLPPDPDAPDANFSHVLEWSLLPPDIQHTSRHHCTRGC